MTTYIHCYLFTLKNCLDTFFGVCCIIFLCLNLIHIICSFRVTRCINKPEFIYPVFLCLTEFGRCQPLQWPENNKSSCNREKYLFFNMSTVAKLFWSWKWRACFGVWILFICLFSCIFDKCYWYWYPRDVFTLVGFGLLHALVLFSLSAFVNFGCTESFCASIQCALSPDS